MNRKLYIVGIGPGGADFLTGAAVRVLKTADCVFVAKRHRALVEGAADAASKLVLMEGLDEALLRIEENLRKGSVAVAVSGDTGIFSYMKKLKERFEGTKIEAIPGISALQFLCAALGETWDDAEIVSVHGRGSTPAKIAGLAAHNGKTIFFCGPSCDPACICRILSDYGLDTLDVAVGERLSYPDGRVSRALPRELAARTFDALSVVRVFNPDPLALCPPRPKDEDFLRAESPSSRIPMTREEVRTIVLDKLELTPESVVWDIGAGTGSVSVACALFCPYGEVHAVERSADAAALLRSNKSKFKSYNLKICEGGAAALLDSLPCPTHVFVGGSGGELPQILEHARKRGDGIRIVVGGVTLKTICAAGEILNGQDFRDFDVVQVAVSRSKTVGGSTILAAQNPVTLLSAWTGGAKA